jgi:putative copper resistance protein D
MLEAGLILSRFLHYLSVLSLFGTALYPLYAFRGEPSKAWLAPSRALIAPVCAVALASAVGWLLATVGLMAGGWEQLADAAVWRAVLNGTLFGPLWLVRLFLLAVALAAVLLLSPGRRMFVIVAILGALSLASLALTGHTQEGDSARRWIQVPADAVHLLAAGAWIGGLLPLVFSVVESLQPFPSENIADGLRRFSGVAGTSVAILIASGVINAWFLVGSWRALVASTYGNVLDIKLAFFLLMLVLAALNRFVLTPRIESGSPANALTALRRSILTEQLLAALAIGCVSVLGTLALPD